jgi:hypothetical protein
MKYNYSNNNRFQLALWRLLIVWVNQGRGYSIINHVTEEMLVLLSKEITGAWRGVVFRAVRPVFMPWIMPTATVFDLAPNSTSKV